MAFAGSPGSGGDGALGESRDREQEPGHEADHFPHGHPQVQVESGHWPDMQQSQLHVRFFIVFLLIELTEAENAAAVFSHGEPLLDPLSVALSAFVRLEGVGIVAQDGFENGLCARLDAVVDPLVPARRCEDSGLLKCLQVRGKRRLTYLHCIGKLADAQLAFEQRGKDSDAGRIGEGFAKEDDIVHSFISGNDDMIPQVPAFLTL